MMKHRLKRAISLLCAFAICVGLLPAGALAVNESANLSGGINGYQATMQADVITSNGWQNAFVAADIQDAVNIGGTQRSSALNGKIWADKSVAIGTDKEFDVTFSTLGQTFASTETSNEEVAFDVMFVLDRSGSMQTGGRASDAVNAINNAMEALLIGEGTDNNRVGIVTFSDGASTALPLRHYSKLTNWSGEQDFFSYTRVDYRGYWIQAGYENGGQVQEEVSFAGGTYTQSGIANGIDALIGGLNDADADGIERIPVVILLTDGAPTYYNRSYDNLANGSPDGNGSSTNGETHGYYTVRTAVSYKQKLADAFAQKYLDSNNTPKFYTIGQGLSGDFAETLLNPTADKIRTAWYSWEDEEAQSLAQALFNRGYSSIDNSFSYADGSYTGEMTQEQLEQIFNEIISSITSITGGEDVGESTGGRDKVTYYDTLGEGVRFTDTMTLRVPKFDQTEDGGLTQGNTDVYQLTAYAAVTIGDIAAGTQMNMKNAPAYLAAGGRIEFRPSSEYQKALEGLNVSVTMLSSGKRQLQVDIPPSLMAYNIINTNTTETTGTTYAYYEAKEPLQLTYSVQMREDVNNAGSYLIGAPAETYVEFYPSSAQDAEGHYEMPYYWPGGLFEDGTDQNTRNKDSQGIEGSSDYIYSATKGNNNNVRIYLGNNGLYTLTGKTMNLTVNWDDNNNQDGIRPDSVKVQLYVDPTGGDFNASNLEAVVDSVQTLNVSNSTEGDANSWQYTFTDLPVYIGDNNAVAKYYMVFLDEDNQPIQVVGTHKGYTHTVDNIATGASENDSTYFLFDGYENDSSAVTGNLELTFTHVPETTSYTVEKIWQGEIGNSATMQLVANGQNATVAGAEVKMTSANNQTSEGSHTWTYTWNNLPKYSNGEEITYRVAETAVGANEGVYYQTSYAYTDAEGDTPGKTTVTNTSQDAEQAKMNFTARVFWDDADNVDNVRPKEVTLKLVAKANGQAVQKGDLTGIQLEQTVSGPDWTVVWNNLPRFTSAHEQITYSIVELKDGTELSVGGDLNDNYKVSDYSSFGDGYMTVTNTHTPATVAITITKEWSDNNNQDGIRPSSVSGVLYKKVGESEEITAVRTFSIPNTSGSITLSGLPKNEGGQAITYYVSEHAVNGYTLSVANAGTTETVNRTTIYPVTISSDNIGSITLTNTHTPTTQDYTATFVWNDNNNIDRQRPETIKVTLTGTPVGTQGGDPVFYEITLNVNNSGVASVDNSSPSLPEGATAKIEDGKLIITGLPSYAEGSMLSYTMAMEDPGNGYNSSISDFTQNSVNFVLSYTSQPVNLGFTKTWVDTDNEGMRPSAEAYARYLTLTRTTEGSSNPETVYVQPTVTDNNGTYTVTYNNLPKRDDNGVAYTYTVTESKVPNYTASSNTVTLTANNANQLTNTYAQEVYETITVTKQWVGDADGQRPALPTSAEGDPLNIGLYVTGTETNYANALKPDIITENDDTWTYTWNNVPSTNADGSAISYVAYESEVPAGYTATVRQVNVINGTASGSIINTLNSGAVTTGTLTIKKSWQGDGQYTDKRPTRLSFTVTGKVAGGTNNISRTVTMSNDWADVVVADLPLTINGQKVTYTVTETNIPDGYSAEYSGEVVLADVQDNAATITVTNTYTPDTWTLTYHANGGTGAPTDDTAYSKTNASAPVKDQEGMTYGSNIFLGWTTEIHGVVVDANDVPATLYKAEDTLTMTGDATLYAVWAVDSNGDSTPDYQQKIITVNVVWQDDSNRCGIRPNMIEFTLDGKEYTVDLANSTDVRVTTNGGNTRWIYEIVVDADAAISEGSITAVNVTPKTHADPNDTTGYTSSVAYANDVFTITLTHTPETTSHYVTKNWTYDNQPIFTADKATIRLLGNGKDVAGANDITFTPSTAGGSEDLGWDNLPKYEGGQLITYQAIETSVKDTDGNEVSNQYDVTYQWTNERTTITNTYNQKRSVTLVYQWDDNGDAAGKRPDSVTIQLYYTIADDTTTRAAGDPQLVTDSSRTISENADWSVTWNDLPVHDINNTGKVIQYEAHVTAYTVAGQSYPVDLFDDPEDTALGQSGYSFDVAVFGMDSVFIMNSAMDTTTDFTVTKQWNDANNAYTTRPDTIWVNLMQDGVIYQSAEVKADASGNWTHTWADLPVYPTDGTGVAYDYTVSEIPVPGYTSTVAGNTITNALDALSNPDDPDNQLTVTFVYNNGQQNTTQTVPFGGTATSITPTWDGHAFKGWYTDNDTFVNPYDFTDPVTNNITLYAKWVSIHDGQEDKDDHHFVTFVYENASATNNGTAIAENTKIQVACGSDYTFTAAADSGYILNTPTKVGSATLVANGNNSFTLDNITSDITVTITATRQTTGGSTGGGGGGGTTRPELEKGDHFAYIVGYEDGTVRPENNITRAEVATIFFRLLTEESREAYYSEVNAFTDVSDGDWYNNAISTLVNADIITGYTDGSFRPDAYITRAELAAIASRFDDISGGETRLTDIDGHWAEELISSAYNKGWVDGYPDGSFRPDQNITRAEVMTLVNRVLERAVDQDGMLDDMVTWSDNQPSSWYYEAVQEATNSHDYSRDEGETLETWTEITPPRDWTELEK